MNTQDIPETEKPVSKVQAVKQFLAEHPDASPREVGEALVAQGFLNLMRLRVTDELTKAPGVLASDDLETAGRIVAMNQIEHLSLLQERFPAWADKVEYWEIDESLDALARIEHEVMDLTARLIRGGERQKWPASTKRDLGEISRRLTNHALSVARSTC